MILRVGSANRGFTLIELLLVLMLLGVSSLIVLPTIDNGLRERNVRRSALGLAAVARELRSQAVSRGIPQSLVLNVGDNSYLAGQVQEVRLPSDVRFSHIAGGQTLDSEVRQFVFFPNGSSLGGRIGLSAGANAISYSVRLEPLSGRVDILRDDNS